jgi:ubiquinone/menaquinone biosynthesis C-methylase UbiE
MRAFFYSSLRKDMSDVWSQYWLQGHPTTFGAYFDDGYRGAIADFVTEDLLSNNLDSISITEFCCGNGATLAPLAGLKRPIEYTGIDLAQVKMSRDTESLCQASGIGVTMIPNTGVENTPLQDHSQDFVLSIYGIEYSDIKKSIAEARRVLIHGGRLRALMHHSDSSVAKMSRRALDEFNSNDIARVTQNLRAISDALNRLASPQQLKLDPEAEIARSKINGLCNKYLGDTDPVTGNAFMIDHMSGALRFFKMLGQPTDVRSKFIEDLELESRSSRERHQQMVDVAYDEASMSTLTATMLDNGWCSVDFEPYKDNEGVIGWSLIAVS